jgi:hypothetical protein
MQDLITHLSYLFAYFQSPDFSVHIFLRNAGIVYHLSITCVKTQSLCLQFTPVYTIDTYILLSYENHVTLFGSTLRRHMNMFEYEQHINWIHSKYEFIVWFFRRWISIMCLQKKHNFLIWISKCCILIFSYILDLMIL